MQDVTFIEVLCVRCIGEKIMTSLDIRDVASLMQTCKLLNNHLNSPQIWHSLNRVHFGQSPMELYKQSARNAYLCGHETYIGNEWFTCTNTPIYTYTVCKICLTKTKICAHCARREQVTRAYCDDCELHYRICDVCEIIEPDFNIIDHMRICDSCEMNMCSMHFINKLATCTECLIIHPELVGYEVLVEVSDEEPAPVDDDHMFRLLIEVSFDEELSDTSDESDSDYDYV
jgi:F-box domain